MSRDAGRAPAIAWGAARDHGDRPRARSSESRVQGRSSTACSRPESEVGKTGWFAGRELSAAHIQMSSPVEGAQARAGLTQATRPNSFAFLQRIDARPAYPRALAKGGPHDVGQVAQGPSPT